MEKKEGKRWSVIMKRFVTKDPLDFEATKHLDERISNAPHSFNAINYKIIALQMERDSRGLFELAQNTNKIIESQKEFAILGAHCLAGRYSVAIPGLEKYFETRKLNSKYQLEFLYSQFGLAYYEVGDYKTAQKALTIAFEHGLAHRHSSSEDFFSEVFADIERRLDRQ
jgi:hypothetical protein